VLLQTISHPILVGRIPWIAGSTFLGSARSARAQIAGGVGIVIYFRKEGRSVSAELGLARAFIVFFLDLLKMF
jgi:hypothetical protein